MIQSPPLVLQNSSHSAKLARQAISSTIGAGGGVISVNSLNVFALGSPAMAVAINGGGPTTNILQANGECWIPGTQAADQGAYYAINDATLNVTIAAADPSNPRIDLVGMWVQDAAYSGSTNSVSAAVITGTPAASPVAPTAPNNFLALANVLVPAAASSITSGDITDERVLMSSRWNSGLVGVAAGKLTGNGTVSLPNGTATTIPLNTAADYLVGGFTRSGSSLVVPVDGIYRVVGSFSITTASGFVSSRIVQTGFSTLVEARGSSNGSSATIVNVVGEVQLAAGESIGLQGFQNSGSAVTTNSPSDTSTFLAVSLASVIGL